MVKVAAILLGAGLSSRMGQDDKLFLPVDGKAMVEWTISNLYYCLSNQVILVGNDLSLPKLKQYENSKVSIIENPDYQQGMTTSIQCGLNNAVGSDGYMICLGDQPFIRTVTYNLIIEAFQKAFIKDQKCIIVPYHEISKGNPVIFSSAYKSDILNHKNMEGCRDIIAANKEHVVKIMIDSIEILQDIDTPEDYEDLQ